MRRGYFHSEMDPEVTVIHKGHTEDNTTIEIEVKNDNRGLGVNPNLQLADLELDQSLPAEIKINVSVADNLVILHKIILRRIYLQAKCRIDTKEYPITKDVPTFMKVIQKKKKPMAIMYHSGETYSSIQV